MAFFHRAHWPRAIFTPPQLLPFEPGEPWAAADTDAGTIFPFGLTFEEAIWFFWRVRHWKITCTLSAGGGDLTDPPDGSSLGWTSVTATCHSGDSNTFLSATNASRSSNRTGRRQRDILSAASEARHGLGTPIFGVSSDSTVTASFPAAPPDFNGSIETDTAPFTISVRATPSGLEPPTPSWLGRKEISGAFYYYFPIEAQVSFDSDLVSPVTLTASSRGSGSELADFVLKLPGRDLSRPLYGSTTQFAGVSAPIISNLVMEPHSYW